MLPTQTQVITFSDGSKREIRFNLGVFKRLKEKFGYSFLNGEAWSKLDETVLPDVIYEALTDKSDMTPDLVAELISIDLIPDIMDSISLALNGKKVSELDLKGTQNPKKGK
jgi:hypothetical protein